MEKVIYGSERYASLKSQYIGIERILDKNNSKSFYKSFDEFCKDLDVEVVYPVPVKSRFEIMDLE